MAKTKGNLKDQVMFYLKLTLAIAAVVTMMTKSAGYFAKAKTVSKMDSRLDLKISQDEVNRKKADIRWMKQQTIFERKTEPQTAAEKEIIKEYEEELTKSRFRHEERVNQYEEQYGDKAQL